ncbi:TrmH family RNA methyltransferase [Actinomyces sp. B33]|uniref:TrmH family RNA methyltransferase n=1 Tax=Actinomyces sp. B33 TaxID=2942131 RepID=UPI0023418E1E|nr:TrmH family RNA methyltransferase [Actinomyces sp. B33]MDC4232238.1 TrmH family RNA methyltransferase [Actinomyces sp. B33]
MTSSPRDGAATGPVGAPPWPSAPDQWPDDPRYDPELLALGDARNVEDRYRYWTVDAIRADVASRALPFEVAVENLGHDFNIGSIVRTANALGARSVHIVGRRRWNRRGAMVTDRYIDVDHLPDARALADHCRARGLVLVGVDNIDGSVPLEGARLPARACLVFGEESNGLSEQMVDVCERVVAITQRGSTRSMNVGHAAAIAMWAQAGACAGAGLPSSSGTGRM